MAERGDTEETYANQYGPDQRYYNQHGRDIDQVFGDQHGLDTDQGFSEQHGEDTDQEFGDQQLQLRKTQIRTIRLAPGLLVQFQQNRRPLFLINDVEHYPQRKHAEEEQKQEPIRIAASWAAWCSVTSVLLLAILIPLGYFIPSLPAHMVLPFDEVNSVNMLCRPRTKTEVYQNLSLSKKQSHRTVCTFNIFHYDLLDRNKTYFVLDIDINIAKAYRVVKSGKLITMKLFHLNEQSKTFHKQRNMYWSISLCTIKDQLSLCLDDIYYRRETVITTKVISTVGMDEKKVVSFLFVVDNIDQLMHVYSPIVLWKDVVFLKHYYEGQTLSLWISLTDRKLEDSISARIRSGSSVTIGDLPNPAIATNYEIIRGTLTYPFRCMYHYFLPNPKPVSVEETEETDIE
ncbi:uncharacterized protein [Argopecten irradians]|uniref:uncharacterized protein isoform X1 n=1 Tax=Argopecten irradians TaxID=31199 RepID=UPI00371CDEC6